jgi:3-methylfumaryl-CoA hydratase
MTAPAGAGLANWIGKTETVTDTATATPYAALSATLDRAAERPPPGTPLPPLWHWLYFLPLYRQSEVGPDGHAKRGDFLPPVPLPRRMWAGSQLEFAKPLRVGDRISRVSTIADVAQKNGRTGSLVFVKVRHEISANDDTTPAIVEFHDIVYTRRRSRTTYRRRPSRHPRTPIGSDAGCRTTSCCSVTRR